MSVPTIIQLRAWTDQARCALQKTPSRVALLGLYVAFIIFLKSLYLWAPQYDLEWRLNNLQVLVVDYDGGLLGLQLNTTYQTLSGPTFPHFTFSTQHDFETEDEIFHAVKRQSYWGAIYTRPNASSRIAATTNEPFNVEQGLGEANLVYVWNEANYPTVGSWIRNSLKQASEDIRLNFVLSRTFAALPVGDDISTQTVQATLGAVSNVLQPLEMTACAGKALGQAAFNHLAMIALSTGSEAFLQIFARTIVRSSKIRGHVKFRLYCVAGTFFSCFLGLAMTASPWVVRGRAGSNLGGREFFLSWMALWAGSITIYAVSCALRTWAQGPLSTKPLTMIWMAMNAASAFVPIEISPTIFRCNWILPGHAVYRLLVTVWCRAGTWETAIVVPVLAFWFGLGTFCTWWGMTKGEKEV
ncbi:Hypothetical predicted protein [Lecanosticta acicola]|uniref:DUF3533 domain-containing protein n=1 Tax=Lecanosticta acicola TaxID=111012 RepID=A0AAI9EB17_9PEZI|nr:Hypothetical predicted protein [Lecanosticta acicola]